MSSLSNGLAPKHVRAGALLSLSFDSRAVGRQAGKIARQMLDNRKRKWPRLVSPDSERLSVNIHTATAMGLTIPDAIIKRVENTYE